MENRRAWCFILGIQLCLRYLIYCVHADSCGAIRFLHGTKMDGHTMRSVTGVTHAACALECYVLTDCLSLNYRSPSGPCELNSEDTTTAPSSMHLVESSPDDKYIYSDISQWPPGLAGECAHHTCPARSRCSPGKPPTCVQSNCPTTAPWVENSQYTMSGVTVGDTATYSCDSGYYMSDSAEVTCLPSYTWSAVSFTCIQCSAPPIVENAEVEAGDVAVGTSRTYHCLTPQVHTLLGTNGVTCQANAQWSPVQFECREPGSCTELQQCNPVYTSDDHYWLYPVYYRGDRVKVYCWRMDTGSPTEYITLPYPQNNVAEYRADVARDYWETGGDCSISQKLGDRKSTFNKIGLNIEEAGNSYLPAVPATQGMTVVPTDTTFAAVNNEKASDAAQNYGTAGDCTYAGKCLKLGKFSVDTSGTGLIVNASLVWKGTGWGGKTDEFTRDAADPRKITSLCGGKCGGCAPETDMRLVPNTAEVLPETEAIVHTCV